MNDMRGPGPRRPGHPTNPTNSNSDHIERMSEMLMAQAASLDAMFVELSGKATEHMTSWPSNARSYVKLALRAQANCRSALDAMARAERANQPPAPRPAKPARRGK